MRAVRLWQTRLFSIPPTESPECLRTAIAPLFSLRLRIHCHESHRVLLQKELVDTGRINWF